MKLNLKTKLAYGLAGVGDSTLYNLAGTFLLFFLSTIVGLDPGISGTIAAIGSVWETICGAVIGYISDNTCTRFGKRKPFLMIAAFPLAIFTALLFTTIDAGPAFRAFYYGLMQVLFWTGFSTFFVPYLAWGAELTQDYDERTVLRGYTFFFNNLGMAVGMILPTVIVDVLVRWGRSEAQSWQLMALFCGICSALTIFFGAFAIRDRFEKEYQANEISKRKRKGNRTISIRKILGSALDMLKNYGEILKMRTIRYIIATSIFYLIAYAVFCANRMYFFTYNMELSAGKITFIMSLMTFASVAFVPVILAASRRFDKRTLYLIGMGICAAVMGIFGFTGVSSMAAVSLFSIAYCIGSICYWQLVPAMIYDVCEVDQLINNKERAGLVISLQSLSESLANAAGLQLLGLILKFAGFQGDAASQSQGTLFWTHMSFTIIPVIFMLLSMLMMARYPVTKDMYNRVLDALKQRERGETVHMEQFSKLK